MKTFMLRVLWFIGDVIDKLLTHPCSVCDGMSAFYDHNCPVCGGTKRV